MSRLATGALVALALAARTPADASAASGEGVHGFADLHLHITADMRAGGRVIYGRAFHPRGIARRWAATREPTAPTGAAT